MTAQTYEMGITLEHLPSSSGKYNSFFVYTQKVIIVLGQRTNESDTSVRRVKPRSRNPRKHTHSDGMQELRQEGITHTHTVLQCGTHTQKRNVSSHLLLDTVL